MKRRISLQDRSRLYKTGGKVQHKTGGPSGPGGKTQNLKPLQKMLSDLGLYTGPIDGVYGPQTEQALTEFSKQSAGVSSMSDSGRRMQQLLGIPLNVRQLLYDLKTPYTEQKAPLTEEDLTTNEMTALRQLVRENLKQGKTRFNYKDYKTTEPGDQYSDVSNVSLSEIPKKLFDPNYNLKTTIGQGQIVTTPTDTFVVDSYNFNNAKSNGLLESTYDFLSGVASNPNPYGLVRSLGKGFGSAPGEGSPVIINTSQKPKEQQPPVSGAGGSWDDPTPTNTWNYSQGRMYATGGPMFGDQEDQGTLNTGSVHTWGGASGSSWAEFVPTPENPYEYGYHPIWGVNWKKPDGPVEDFLEFFDPTGGFLFGLDDLGRAWNDERLTYEDFTEIPIPGLRQTNQVIKGGKQGLSLLEKLDRGLRLFNLIDDRLMNKDKTTNSQPEKTTNLSPENTWNSSQGRMYATGGPMFGEQEDPGILNTGSVHKQPINVPLPQIVQDNTVTQKPALNVPGTKGMFVGAGPVAPWIPLHKLPSPDLLVESGSYKTSATQELENFMQKLTTTKQGTYNPIADVLLRSNPFYAAASIGAGLSDIVDYPLGSPESNNALLSTAIDVGLGFFPVRGPLKSGLKSLDPKFGKNVVPGDKYILDHFGSDATRKTFFDHIRWDRRLKEKKIKTNLQSLTGENRETAIDGLLERVPLSSRKLAGEIVDQDAKAMKDSLKQLKKEKSNTDLFHHDPRLTYAIGLDDLNYALGPGKKDQLAFTNWAGLYYPKGWNKTKNLRMNRLFHPVNKIGPYRSQRYASTLLHEGTHAFTDAERMLGTTPFTNKLLSRNMVKEQGQIRGPWQGHFYYDKPEQLKYYTRPTEIHARINQLRHELGKKPGESITTPEFKKLWDDGHMLFGMRPYIKNQRQFARDINYMYKTGGPLDTYMDPGPSNDQPQRPDVSTSDTETLVKTMVQRPEYSKYDVGEFMDMMDKIAIVESKDRNIPQDPSGPGRGYFQLETTTYPVAQQRLANYMKETGVKLPMPNAKDIMSLSRDHQRLLALINMHKAARNKGAYLNPADPKNMWLNYHWAGAQEDRPKRIAHWNSHF